MSFQLIYTSAAHLLDSGMSGYGVVARSHSLPRALAVRLLEMSDYNDSADRGITGPQFSYKVVAVAGASFHVISCVQPAGTDYSHRSCYIAHHLALTSDEVQALRRNSSRPTPAGVALALQRMGFWRQRWEGEPQYIEQEPRLTASSLPDATVQATWKAMTGHKGNARAFFTHPYDHECLVCLPRGTGSLDVLLLINESDWLSANRGWDRTFTTCGSKSDRFSETQRICVASGSDLEQRSSFASRPCLRISPQMKLQDWQEPPSAESSPLGAGPVSRPSVPLPTQFPAAPQFAMSGHLPYKYQESPDEDAYDTPPPRNPVLRCSAYLTLLAVLAGGVYLLTSTKVDHAGKATGQFIQHFNAEENLHLLAALAKEPYSAEKAQRELDKLEARLAKPDAADSPSSPDELKLLECVSLLRLASDAAGHPSNLHRLCELSRELRMPASDICRLYMNEATHDRPLEEWMEAITPEEALGWASFLQETAEMKDWLLQEPFRSYMKGLIVFQDPPPSPPPGPQQDPKTADLQPTDKTDEAIPPPSEPKRGSAAILPLMAGSPLPAPLLDLLGKTPLRLAQGEYRLSAFSMAPGPVPHSEARLNEGGKTLDISPVEGIPNCYKMELYKAGSPQGNTPAAILTLKDGRLHQITCDGRPAAVLLTAPDKEGILHTYILVGKIEIPLVPRGESLPPEAAQLALKITPQDLLLKSSGIHRQPELSLKNHRSFPWAPMQSELQLRYKPTLQLPVLGRNNRILPWEASRESAPPLPYKWKCTRLHGTSSSDIWECKLWRIDDFSQELMQCFLRAANSYCCGERNEGDSFYSLSTLYSIAKRLSVPQLSRKEHVALQSQYCKLFSDPYFADILKQIFHREPQLCLDPAEAMGKTPAHRQARADMGKRLASQHNRDLIRQRICEVLTRTVIQTYSYERQKKTRQSCEQLVLKLRQVDTNPQGELLWYFSLQPAGN